MTLPLRAKQGSAHVSQLGCGNLCFLGKGHFLEELKGLRGHTLAPPEPVQAPDTGSSVAQMFKP